jgi:hypothetical protein
MAVSSVASTNAAGGAQLLAPDSKRQSVIICNDDANRLYVLLDGGTVSTSNYSFSLGENENARLSGDEAQGEIKGIWSADGAGSARLTTKF